MAYKEPETPFGGFVRGTKGAQTAVTAPHVLVSGLTGSGKSRRVLGPGILMWDGPVVAVSSKPDLVQLTMADRLADDGYGRTYLIDLSGEVPDDFIPAGVQRLVVDPVALIASDDDALDMATVLMKTGSVGAGQSQGDAFWETISAGPLAALLRAAGSDGMRWARAAVGAVDAPGGSDEDTPSWVTAAQRLEMMGSTMLADELASAGELEDKMRDSVVSTMKSAVAPWLRTTVAGRVGDAVFTPALLEHPKATLYMVAPADGVAAGAAVSVAEFVSKRWRRNQSEPVKLPRVLMVVDELCNTMPWPKLPTVVTEARAMGIHLLVAVQGTSQFARRYGRDGMDELRDVFPAVLCLYGAPEKEMLEKAAWWSGQGDVQKASMDYMGRMSQNTERRENLSAHGLQPTSIDEGRLLRGRISSSDPRSEVGIMVDLLDIDEIEW